MKSGYHSIWLGHQDKWACSASGLAGSSWERRPTRVSLHPKITVVTQLNVTSVWSYHICDVNSMVTICVIVQCIWLPVISDTNVLHICSCTCTNSVKVFIKQLDLPILVLDLSSRVTCKYNQNNRLLRSIS